MFQISFIVNLIIWQIWQNIKIMAYLGKILKSMEKMTNKFQLPQKIEKFAIIYGKYLKDLV